MLAASSTAEPGDLLLPLNWRAMLGDTATRTVPDPTVQLELQQGSRISRHPVAAAAVAGNSSSTIAPACAGPAQATCTRVSTVAPSAALVSNTGPVAPAAAPAVVVPPVMRSPGSPEPARESPLVKSSGHESPAARSLKLAAQHLEEAANIPVQVGHGLLSAAATGHPMTLHDFKVRCALPVRTARPHGAHDHLLCSVEQGACEQLSVATAQ